MLNVWINFGIERDGFEAELFLSLLNWFFMLLNCVFASRSLLILYSFKTWIFSSQATPTGDPLTQTRKYCTTKSVYFEVHAYCPHIFFLPLLQPTRAYHFIKTNSMNNINLLEFIHHQHYSTRISFTSKQVRAWNCLIIFMHFFHLALVLTLILLTDNVHQVFSSTETETLRCKHSVLTRQNITQNYKT
jgi:hypothetical protein